MATFKNIGIDEPTTIDLRVATVEINRGGTLELQEIVTLGDPESSAAIARVPTAAPESTMAALAVRIVSGPSTAADAAFAVQPVAGSTFATRPLQSSAADLQMTATPLAGSTWNVRPLQSSAADLQMTATPLAGSTWNVRPLQSSAADLQMTATPLAGSTWNVRPLQSSQGDLRATVYQSTATDFLVSANIRDSSGTGFVGTTTRPSTGAQGLVVRPVLNDLQSTGRSTTGNGSTRETFVSSVAGQRIKVYAYSITSTVTTANTVAWYSSNANMIWPVVLQAVSSAISGANLAVSPPAWLFATDAANALTFGISGSTGTYHVGVSWFVEA